MRWWVTLVLVFVVSSGLGFLLSHLVPSWPVAQTLVISLGSATTVGIIFSIIAQRRRVTEYFGRALADIMINHEWIMRLRAEEKDRAKHRLVQDIYGRRQIERWDSFYHFINSNILSNCGIDKLYRENVIRTLKIEESDGKLLATETNVYQVRGAGYEDSPEEIDFRVEIEDSIPRGAFQGILLDEYTLDVEFQTTGVQSAKLIAPGERPTAVSKIDRNAEGYFLQTENGVVNFRFVKKVKVKRGRATVSTKSSYPWDPNDNFWCFSTPYPTKDCSLAVILPAGFLVSECVLGHVHYTSDEDRAGDVPPVLGMNVLLVTISGWIIPGLVCALKWNASTVPDTGRSPT